MFFPNPKTFLEGVIISSRIKILEIVNLEENTSRKNSYLLPREFHPSRFFITPRGFLTRDKNFQFEDTSDHKNKPREIKSRGLFLHPRGKLKILEVFLSLAINKYIFNWASHCFDIILQADTRFSIFKMHGQDPSSSKSF